MDARDHILYIYTMSSLSWQEDLTAQITASEVVDESYVQYTIRVHYRPADEPERTWTIVRRYSDFVASPRLYLSDSARADASPLEICGIWEGKCTRPMGRQRRARATAASTGYL